MTEMEDVTGKPRSNEDIARALIALNETVVKMAATPMLIHYMVIRDALVELLARRAKDEEPSP